MRILVLGWEYPPLISGGLAVATEGIINGLIAEGHNVILVLPSYPYPGVRPGLTIVSPELLQSISIPKEEETQVVSSSEEAAWLAEMSSQPIFKEEHWTVLASLVSSHYEPI